MASGDAAAGRRGNGRMLEERTRLLREVRACGTLPRHVAIIMDGNGRWAERAGLPRLEGHRAGVEAVRETVRLAGEIPLEVLTLFAFSTENWSRPAAEVAGLMGLLELSLRREREELHRNGVRLRVVGERGSLPHAVRREIERTEEHLAGNRGLLLCLAVNYSGRSEITRAMRMLAERVREGQLDPGAIQEETVGGFLDTAGLPDPDLLIRTSGEQRVSNFLLWQLAYTELWVTPVLWPDFTPHDLLRGILEYQQRERRFGRVAVPAQEGALRG